MTDKSILNPEGVAYSDIGLWLHILSNGVYMVRVNTATGSALHKIVKR